MEEGGGEVATHPLSKAQLTNGSVEQCTEVEESNEFVDLSCIGFWRDPVDVSQQFERLDDRQIPPELSALPENDSDLLNMSDTLFPGRPP